MTGATVVAVIGAGASGTLTAIHLTAAAGQASRRTDIVLVDPDPVGRGVAYSSPDPRHRLNVPAGRMSAWPDRPEHFTQWLIAHVDADATAATFAPRHVYGRYLRAALDDVVAATESVNLTVLSERVTGLSRHGRRLRMTLESAYTLPVDAAVLAIGHGHLSTDWAPAELRRSPRFIADPWSDGALQGTGADQPVLLVGSGLTMADVARVVGSNGSVVHTVSRHGLLPLAHPDVPAIPVPAPALPPAPLTWPAARRFVFDHVRSVKDAGGDVRAAVDSLRPITTALWQLLPEPEQQRFLSSGARRWDRMRHRVEPTTGEFLRQAHRDGRLVVHTGEISRCQDGADRLTVTISNGSHQTVLDLAAVVNCTGPRSDLSSDSDPLILNLLTSGTVAPGRHHIGLTTDDQGRVLAMDGAATRIWTLGPLRRGQLWESTAVPEIRAQASSLATALVAELPPARLRRRPRDTYGLPLSATREAAAFYNDAHARILRVQSGAPELMEQAVLSDPTFALGHATRALLGHEWGDPSVDVAASIDTAVQLIDTADERERQFIQVAAERIQRSGPRSAVSLIAHIQAYPEDALAVSLAVPTIAFGGATELPQEAWALVEGLAPAYGQDWWYQGLLAFIRQEQSRWGEAMDLAVASLAAEPASAHAAHARTHVHYETGDHQAGITWLDEWIATQGPANAQRVHFSWHGALHELAVGDARAAARRYVCQLAPPTVTGVRALIDSATLLWRGHLAGAWGWPNVNAVLETVPRHLLLEPPTPFIAMHAAVALTAAEDGAGLARLAASARAHAHPAFNQTIAGMADALMALVDGNPGLATDGLLRLEGVDALGGSAAQREVVEETLLYCAMAARRHELAAGLLRARLDRRPSVRDVNRLIELVEFPAATGAHAVSRTRRPVRLG